ncbi:MAG: ferric iron uptake transcriptional regulator [Magnetococcales bacterium]|nr:ferric iron uptake transcriptional regulator [Magnetococcales bacterium]
MDISNNLRKAGLKATLPRLKILGLFNRNPKMHLSAEEVYKKLLNDGDEIGLATVYRVLTQFEGADLLVRHFFEGGKAVFELNRGIHHDHLVCLQCGKVEEFLDDVIEDRQRKLVNEMGFTLKDHSLYIFADCNKSDCPNKPNRDD